MSNRYTTAALAPTPGQDSYSRLLREVRTTIAREGLMPPDARFELWYSPTSHEITAFVAATGARRTFRITGEPGAVRLTAR